MMFPNSAFSNAFSSAAFNTVVPAASVADANSSLSFTAIPNDHARSMRPTFYSMWLEGSARKAPAQWAPFAEPPFCLPRCSPSRFFKVEKRRKCLRYLDFLQSCLLTGGGADKLWRKIAVGTHQRASQEANLLCSIPRLYETPFTFE